MSTAAQRVTRVAASDRSCLYNGDRMTQPEAEVAHSTRSIGMHQKWRDYRRAGVREYVVLCVEEAAIHWFRFKPDGKLVPDDIGIFRSVVFPGLWLDSAAVLAHDHARAARTLRKGLKSPEHAAFVRALRAREVS
jgi:hypothetical protein